MIKIQFEQLVEDYYYDRLDEESRVAFRTRMIVDTVFADQVERYIRGLEVVRDNRNMTLKTRFEKQEDQIRQKAIWMKVARFAALIVLTLAIPFTFMQYVFGKKNLSNKKSSETVVTIQADFQELEEFVEWIVDVTSDNDDANEVSPLEENFSLLWSDYGFDENTDFTGLEDIYDYVIKGVFTPLPDISPELADRFTEILDSDPEYVTNLLTYIVEETEQNKNEPTKH